MIYISNKDEQNDESTSNSKQYLLRVVYDSEDKNVHKLLEGIFGPDQMLDVKNGKIAKINSTLTPKERDCFLEMISGAINKMELQKDNEPNSKELEDIVSKNNNEEKEDSFEEENEIKEANIAKEQNEAKEEIKSTNEDDANARKVSAEKLIEEFAKFLNSIS